MVVKMCKVVFGSCTFVLFCCMMAMSTADKNFTIKINGSNIQYEYHAERVTWDEARESCSAAGALLVAPEDAAETAAVRGEVNAAGDRWGIWTGITDLDKTGVYQTLDGRPVNVDHHKWFGGNPVTNNPAWRCVSLLHDSVLHVGNCEWSGPYVCKFLVESESASPAYKTDMTVTFQINTTGFQYDLHRDPASWWQAAKHCWATNAQLWVPEGEAEQRAVRLEVDRVAQGFAVWTGMSNQDTTGVYRDSRGQPVSADLRRFWHAGQPDTVDHTRLCVLLKSDSSLFNYYCDWTYYYVCKYPTASEYTKPSSYYKIPWGGNITFIAEKTLYVYHKEKATWQQARQRCSSARTLLAPGDEAEAQAVAGAMKRINPRWGIWTSLSDRQEIEVSFQTTQATFLNKLDEWFEYWFGDLYKKKRHNYRRTAWRCLGLRSDSSKYEADCDWPGPYVCKFPMTTEGINPTPSSHPALPSQSHNVTTPPARGSPATTPASDNPGKKFTIENNGTDILYVFHYEYVSWHQARERCAFVGAQLWAPMAEGEARAVRGKVNRDFPYWSIWTGINDLNTSGAYHTLEGQPLNEFQLKRFENQPEARDSGYHCVQLMYPNSSLFADPCDGELPYVCKSPAPTTGQHLDDVTLHKDDPNDPISNGWYKRENTFRIITDGVEIQYVYNDVWVTWHQARQRCSAAGAQLWVPECEAEARAVRGEVNADEPFWWIWVGINDLDTRGVYQTSDGRNISAVYHTWRAGRPDSRGGDRRCAGLLPDFTLYTASCDKNFPYVCKFNRGI